jgi:hypothetical protein
MAQDSLVVIVQLLLYKSQVRNYILKAVSFEKLKALIFKRVKFLHLQQQCEVNKHFNYPGELVLFSNNVLKNRTVSVFANIFVNFCIYYVILQSYFYSSKFRETL